MKNIVLIDHEPYSTRRRDLFMIEDFTKLGYKYDVWCLAEYLYKGKYKVTDMINSEHLTNIHSLDELESLIRSIDKKKTIFIVECAKTWRNRKIYKLLSDYNCYTIKMDFYANTFIKKPITIKLKQLFSSRCDEIIKSKIDNFCCKLYKKFFNIKDFRLIFSSSDITQRTDKINHPDYEKIHFEENTPIIKYDYIVFCDVFFPFHPDLINFYHYNNLSDGKSYQQTLTKFFDYLEYKYKMPVIIAAHPKATYKGYEFGNREIIRNQTENLIQNCKMVILHNSNSVSYSILTNKPIVFISTKEYKKCANLNQALHLLASSLGLPVYNLDNIPFEQIKISPINDNIRRQYIYTYLTSQETENKRNKDIILKKINKVNIY